MATDLATLAIRIESLEAVVAKKRVRDLGNEGAKSETKLAGLSKAAKGLAAGFAGLFAARALVGILADVSRTAGKFEASLSELEAITGASASQMAQLSDAAKFLGRTTTLSASEAAEGFKLIASAMPQLLPFPGLLIETAGAAIVLAEATGSSLPEAASTLGQALNQFGEEADQANRFINVLAAGAQFGASMVNETAEALKYAGTVAASANISFEQTNAVIQQLSTVGIKGSEAGAALRNTFLKLEAQTESRFKPSVVGMQQALENLNAAQLSPVELTKLFGLRSVIAASQIIQEAEAVGVLTDKLTGTNTAFEQQKIKVDNLEGSQKALNSAQEGLAIRLGEDINPTFAKLNDVLADTINAYTTYLGKSEAAVDGTGILSWTLETLLGAVFLVRVGFNELGDTIGFAMAVVMNSVGSAGDVAGAAFDYIVSWIDTASIRMQQIGVIFADIGDGIGAFAARVKALLSFDFDLADQIKAARQETIAGAAEELEALDDRARATAESRAAIAGNLADDLAARDATLAAMGEEYLAQRQLTAAKVGQFFIDQQNGAQVAANSEAAVALTEAETRALEEKLAREKELADFVARQAEIADNQSALDQVSDKFRTDIEAAEDAAAEQLRILEELGAAENQLTEEQEAQRLETIRRVNQELVDFREEEAEKAAAAKQAIRDADLKAEQDAASVRLEFEVMAAENEIERANIRHEARIEAIRERGEAEGVAKALIDKAIEQLEVQHQGRLQKIREDAGRKQNAFDKWLSESKVAQAASELTTLTAGLAQHSKTAFKLNKAAGIANAIVSTYQGAAKALSEYAPPWSFAMAAAQIAAGMAQVSAIKSTTFEGGGGGTTPSLAGSTPTYNGQPVRDESNEDLLNPPTAGVNDEVSRNQVIVTGNVGWTPEIIDQVAEGLREATGERDVIIFEEGSRQAQDLIEVTSGTS